ncbi:VOC family protein [Dellaglioa algida]|uniref:VOC family protein n=1 Tax=Dellaglioa algida TaxID=105612 RepID=UPI000BC4CE92|nr:VOC family protein [Dellaglioa algida]MDK1717680.1 VOC family protein [Dellaglioa algida]MDK1728025.1 VOC family protein [Dellaglioa algida]MDK1729417.1 VOC family protein [Dellaglioa algida]MDK1735578.1 VOC family protein [Dellaglioa algida]MDK1737356.1 VOC family protein [Dellaglioa algida]
MKVKRFEAITIPVSNIQRSLRFYHEVFDMTVIENSNQPTVHFGHQKIIFELSNTFKPMTLSFVVSDPMPAMENHLKNYFVTILNGPIDKSDVKNAQSITISDPDNHTIELISYQK